MVEPHSGRTISAEEEFISISRETCASHFIQSLFLCNVSFLSFPPMQDVIYDRRSSSTFPCFFLRKVWGASSLWRVFKRREKEAGDGSIVTILKILGNCCQGWISKSHPVNLQIWVLSTTHNWEICKLANQSHEIQEQHICERISILCER